MVLYAFLLKCLGLSGCVDWNLHKVCRLEVESVPCAAPNTNMPVTWCYTMLHHVTGVVIFNSTRPRSCTRLPVPSCRQALLWRDFLEHRTFNAAFHAVVVPCPARGDSMLFHRPRCSMNWHGQKIPSKTPDPRWLLALQFRFVCQHSVLFCTTIQMHMSYFDLTPNNGSHIWIISIVWLVMTTHLKIASLPFLST